MVQKLLSACIIGKPNVGKSSLLNKIVGQQISIVTPKVQTTRSIITGIITTKDTQIILFDTPGIFEPKGSLEKSMVRCAWSSINSADIVVLVLDSTILIDKITLQILDRIKNLQIPLVFLLNKIDLTTKYLEETEKYLIQHFSDYKICKCSALTGAGIDAVLSYLVAQASPSHWLYGDEEVTNLPMRFLAAEITREQLFLELEQELPYNLGVYTEDWKEKSDESVLINQVIVVSKDAYKAIILGKNGKKIKEIGIKARIKIAEVLGLKIHLFLFVKVREKWESITEVGTMLLPKI
jgi:GTP-binding protein Era